MLENVGNTCKVLVIEDDTLTRMTICNILKKEHYKTSEACTGLMGVTQLRRERPDIVITDIMMPDKGGLETINEIRAIDPSIKIIAMSAGVPEDANSLLGLAEEIGAVNSLCKPFTPQQLLHVLRMTQGEIPK
jgi:DNA-binding response OmpR family regulator